MRRAALVWIASLLIVGLPLAASEVVLRDGRVLSGEVERRGDIYRVTTSDGGVATVPMELVAEVRLGSDTAAEQAEESPAPPVTIPRYVPPRPLPTPPSVQLESFDRLPDWPRPSVMSTRWIPEDALGYKTDVTDFNLSIWLRTGYDPSWAPTSSDGPETGAVVLEPSAFPSSPFDPRWWPTDTRPRADD